MITLYALLILMCGIMLFFPAAAFIHSRKKLLSPAFVSLATLGIAGVFSLYALTGSARALQHWQLLKTVQAMGGLDSIIRKIEKRVAEHPEDEKGRDILERLQKK